MLSEFPAYVPTWTTLVVGLVVASLSFVLRKQKQDDGHEISIAKILDDRLTAVEAAHSKCQLELSQVRERVARLEGRDGLAVELKALLAPTPPSPPAS